MRIIESLLYKLAKCALNFALKLTLRLSCVYLRTDCVLGLRNVVEWKVKIKYHRVNSKYQTLNALKNGYNDTEKLTKRTLNSN